MAEHPDTEPEDAGTETAHESAPPEQEPRIERLWHRVSHVYKTRVRTTTVILVILFLVGIPLYSYTSQRYSDPAPDVAPVQQQTVRSTPTEETSTPESSTSEESPSETSTTGSDGPDASESSTSTPPWYLPRTAPDQTSTTDEPGTRAPQDGSEGSQVPSIH
ncbi:hypothetical protein [Gordonia sp. VNK21]|uniref:hypothetical protein n=1 Tax=Gordonia sp. VNK21 TaxID=3382483 RepID=UPI0038D39571